LLLGGGIATARAEQPPSQVTADLVLLSGKIWTVNQAQPEAEALAVWGDRTLAAGGNAANRPQVDPPTQVIDCEDRRRCPGFHGRHVHVRGGGQQLGRVSLKDAANEEEFGRRLREFDRKLPRDRWLQGDDWDHDRTFNGRLPTAELLDKYLPDRPAFLRRY